MTAMCAGDSVASDAQCVLCYKILEGRAMVPENYSNIYTQNMLIANANLSHILNLSVMNWNILKLISLWWLWMEMQMSAKHHTKWTINLFTVVKPKWLLKIPSYLV